MEQRTGVEIIRTAIAEHLPWELIIGANRTHLRDTHEVK